MKIHAIAARCADCTDFVLITTGRYVGSLKSYEVYRWATGHRVRHPGHKVKVASEDVDIRARRP